MGHPPESSTSGLVQARIDDIDPAELDRSLRLIRNYSTPIILDGELAGSGTLIEWDDSVGILTAHHVVHNPLDPTRRFNFSGGSSQRLGLSLSEFAHRFELEMSHLRAIDIAPPIDSADLGRGPDLSVVDLGNKRLRPDIQARLSLYPIGYKPEERLQEAMRDDGIFVVCGAAKEMESIAQPELGFSEVTLQNLTTYYGGLVRPHGKRFHRDGYSYVEIGVQYRGGDSDPPLSFRGVSGGGLWRIPVSKTDDSGRYVPGNPVLAGVAFWQTSVTNDLRCLRCHAADAIYTSVPRALLTR